MDQNDRDRRMELMQAGLAKVRLEFIASLPGRVEELDALMDQLYEVGADSRGVIDAISRSAHKLHGQAGAFGFADMGKIAAEVEIAAVKVLETQSGFDPEAVETRLVALLDKIDESLEAV